MKTIEIIVPCYNEAGNIRPLFDEIKNAFSGINYNFIVKYIDDGSSDSTVSEVEDLISIENKNVQLIKLSRNFGKESAIVAGMDNVDADSSAAILIDADGQMPASYIPEMISLWENGSKIVITKKQRREKNLHQYLSKKYYKLYNKFGNTNIVEDMLDYQLLDIHVIEKLQQYREVNRYYKSLVLELGFSYAIVNVEIVARVHGESKFGSFTQSFLYAVQVFTSNSTFFLTANLVIGSIISFLSILYAIILMFSFVLYGNDVEGWTTIVVLLSGFSGFILISLGIIGKYIALIFYETKRRPIYIIDKYLKGENNENK